MREARSYMIIALLLAAATAAAAGQSPEAPPLAVSTYARVEGDSDAEEVAARVAGLIDEAVPRIAALLRTDDLRPVPAFVYLDRSRFLEATGMPPRSTVVGLATLPAGVIHIDGTGLLEAIERVVPHEVGHVMIGRAVGRALPALPLWLNEGVAEYVAGERAAQVDPVALRAVGRGTALPLSELDAAFRARGATDPLAYTEAASLVNFLVAQRGEGVIADLLADLRERGNFAAALEQTTGWTVSELESAWRRSVAERWRWPLLLQSPLVPFAVMLLIFIVGLVRFLRERRRRQEMPDEDW